MQAKNIFQKARWEGCAGQCGRARDPASAHIYISLAFNQSHLTQSIVRKCWPGHETIHYRNIYISEYKCLGTLFWNAITIHYKVVKYIIYLHEDKWVRMLFSHLSLTVSKCQTFNHVLHYFMTGREQSPTGILLNGRS